MDILFRKWKGIITVSSLAGLREEKRSWIVILILCSPFDAAAEELLKRLTRDSGIIDKEGILI